MIVKFYGDGENITTNCELNDKENLCVKISLHKNLKERIEKMESAIEEIVKALDRNKIK